MQTERLGYVKRGPKGDQPYVFLAIYGGADAFAHRDQFASSIEWGESLEGMRVRFDVEPDVRGLRATNVRAAD